MQWILAGNSLRRCYAITMENLVFLVSLGYDFRLITRFFAPIRGARALANAIYVRDRNRRFASNAVGQ